MPSRPPRLEPRKTPSQRRSAETVRVILEGAARILEERSLTGFTTNAVAERAGVSIGSLYQYFPGKDALLAALVAEAQSANLAALEMAVAEADGLALVAALRQVIAATIGRQTVRPSLAAALDYAERHLPLDALLADVMTAQAAPLRRLLDAHRDEIAPLDLDRMATDTITIARALFDAAEMDGSAIADPAGTEARLLRAITGYLGVAVPA
jgi:AcrR family transcriptional regulator